MEFKAIKSFSNAYTGNVTSGQKFESNNEGLIAHLLEHKLIEPIGDHAYQNKMLKQDVKKKESPKDSNGSESGKGKPSSASPAVPASPTDKSKPSESGENGTEGESSSPTPPTGTSHSQTSSTDATTAGGDTSPKDASNRRSKTSRKSPRPKGGRKTRAPRRN